jgi:hypothetical protein
MLMDNWLMNLWITRGRPDIRYLPASYLLPRLGAEDPDSISAFRRRFDLPEDGPCPLQWVIGFTNVGGEKKQGERASGGDHYCCMLFMPREKTIHVLGKRHKEASQRKQPSDWESWGGSNISALSVKYTELARDNEVDKPPRLSVQRILGGLYWTTEEVRSADFNLSIELSEDVRKVE